MSETAYVPVCPAATQRDILAQSDVPSFDDHLSFHQQPDLQAGQVDILQINVGKLCNQVCQHCHVDAGPHQTAENMDERTAHAVIDLIATLKPRCVISPVVLPN